MVKKLLRKPKTFEESFESIPKSKFWSKKNVDEDGNFISPRNVFKSSNNKFLFDCEDCKHEISIKLSNVVSGYWCAYCSVPCKKLCEEPSCDFCFKNSFASCKERASCWNKNNEKTPREVIKFSHAKFLFDCKECHHTFSSSVASVAKGRWCAYCKSLKLCLDENCDFCFNKSLASHTASDYWSDKNKVSPRQVGKGTSKKYFFDCDICQHTFEISVVSVTGTNERWCSFCEHQKLCDDEDCNFCFNNSFASQPRSKWFLVDKNGCTPRSIFSYSGKKYYFKCEYMHIFQVILSNVTQGSWCPICKNKTEKKLFGSLSIKYENYRVMHNFKPIWCKNPETKCYLPYDTAIEDFKIIIELDGIQHFEVVKLWKNNIDKNRKRDIQKMSKANEHGYCVIRILQCDVWSDKNNWEKKLDDAIKYLKTHKGIKNIYIDNDKEMYKDFDVIWIN